MIHQRECDCDDCHQGDPGLALFNGLAITFLATLLALAVVWLVRP